MTNGCQMQMGSPSPGVPDRRLGCSEGCRRTDSKLCSTPRRSGQSLVRAALRRLTLVGLRLRDNRRRRPNDRPPSGVPAELVLELSDDLAVRALQPGPLIMLCRRGTSAPAGPSDHALPTIAAAGRRPPLGLRLVRHYDNDEGRGSQRETGRGVPAGYGVQALNPVRPSQKGGALPVHPTQDGVEAGALRPFWASNHHSCSVRTYIRPVSEGGLE